MPSAQSVIVSTDAQWPPPSSTAPWSGSPVGQFYPTISMSTSHMINHTHHNPSYAVEEAHCHWCQFRQWSTHKLYPVSIVNQVPGDTSVLDPAFRFIERSILGHGVELAPKEFMSGCECGGGADGMDGDCLREGCSCLDDIDTEGREQRGEKINAYHVLGERRGCLRGEMLRSRAPIYECNESCKCGPDCPNKVVSRGRKVPLQVFRTVNRGWGLRSTSDIKKGQFVGQYVGELLTSTEAARRRENLILPPQSPLATKASRSSAPLLSKSKTKQQQRQKDVYLFALDKFSNPHSTDDRLRGEPYEIDGEYLAGPTRFINHSCAPNLRIFAVVRDQANKPFHDLCFFATREIGRFEELTFDYTDGVSGGGGAGRKDGEDDVMMDGMEEGEEEEEEEAGMSRCLCGEENCRGWLW